MDDLRCHWVADYTVAKGLLGNVLGVLGRYSTLNQALHVVRFRKLWRILWMRVASCPADDGLQPA